MEKPSGFDERDGAIYRLQMENLGLTTYEDDLSNYKALQNHLQAAQSNAPKSTSGFFEDKIERYYE